MAVPITAFYASLLGVILIYLSFQVILQRRRRSVGIGDGGDKHFLQIIRVHANFTEYVPLCLILMMVAELNGVYSDVLHVSGWTLIVCRFLHAFGLKHHAGVSWQRFVGTCGTFLVLAVLIFSNLAPFYEWPF